MYNVNSVHSVQCTSKCSDPDFCPSGCHFLYIFASGVSRKNWGGVSEVLFLVTVSKMTRVPQFENHCCNVFF